MPSPARLCTPEPPNPITYMRYVAAMKHGRKYKEHVLAELDLFAGQTALVGCGPGTDLDGWRLASVTCTGSVIGVDVDPTMV